MALTWPKERRVIGTEVTRLDGPDKATGRAKYSYDINRPGMLHAGILRSPYAHAKVKSLDTSAAEKMPGVKAVHVIAGPGKELLYAGDEIVGLVADTFKQADFVHEGLYGVPTISHQCLESHGLVAEWEGDAKLTVWCSTQAVTGTVKDLADHFRGALKKPV